MLNNLPLDIGNKRRSWDSKPSLLVLGSSSVPRGHCQPFPEQGKSCYELAAFGKGLSVLCSSLVPSPYSCSQGPELSLAWSLHHQPTQTSASGPSVGLFFLLCPGSCDVPSLGACRIPVGYSFRILGAKISFPGFEGAGSIPGVLGWLQVVRGEVVVILGGSHSLTLPQLELLLHLVIQMTQ